LRSPAFVIGLFVVITAVGLATTATPAHAGLTSFLGLVIAWVMHYIVAFEGWLLIKMVGILIWVAQYNGFVNAMPVATGWFIVRDIVNMFFILMLLIIAFGTILGVERYNYQKTLPTLLLSAVLVNFSRTFCGIFIDISQVIMLTFVNGFSEAATGNFANAFRITQLMDTGTAPEGGNDDAVMMKLVAGWILAAVLIGFSLVVITYMTVVLIVRIIYLWVLVIMSPAAYFLRGVPLESARKYYGEWWNMLIQRLVAGPFIAFFLWLSLLTVAGGSTGGGILKSGGFEPTTGGTGETNGVEMGLFTGEDLQAYMIGMVMLVGGITIAEKMAGLKLSEVTGAPGKAWKNAKGAIDTSKKAWDSASKTKVGQFIGKGTDSVKSGALSVASYVPGMRGAALRAKGELREKMAAKSAVSSKWLERMTPEELGKVAKGGRMLPNALKSPEQLGQERDALKRHMTNLVSKNRSLKREDGESDESYNGRVKKEYQAARNRLEKLGEATHDRTAVSDHIKTTNKTRADLIVEDDLREKNPEKYKKQIKEQTESGRSLGVKALTELEASAMVPQAMMHVNSKTMKKAMESMSTDQLEKLDKIGIKDGMNADQIAYAQNQLKAKNVQYLTEADRNRLVTDQREQVRLADQEIAAAGGNQDAKDAAELRKRSALESLANISRDGGMDKATLGEFAGAGAAGAAVLSAAMASGLKVEAIDLENQPQLANELAKGLSGSDIGKLPGDLAEVLRDAAARQGDASKVLEAGGSAKQAFGRFGYDNVSGSMGGEPQAGDFADAFRANKDVMVSHMQAGALAKNGGINDVSLTMLTEMDMGDLAAMHAGGNSSGAMGVVNSAMALRNADPTALIASYQQRMQTAGLHADAADAMAKMYGERVIKAQQKALETLAEISGSSSPFAAAAKASVNKASRKPWSKYR
jgi:hypothetical protein